MRLDRHSPLGSDFPVDSYVIEWHLDCLHTEIRPDYTYEGGSVDVEIQLQTFRGGKQEADIFGTMEVDLDAVDLSELAYHPDKGNMMQVTAVGVDDGHTIKIDLYGVLFIPYNHLDVGEVEFAASDARRTIDGQYTEGY